MIKKLLTCALVFAALSPFAQTVPNWTKTAINGGGMYDLHTELDSGHAVVLYCGANMFNDQLADYQTLYHQYDKGTNGVKMFYLGANPNETAASINGNLTAAGVTFPAFDASSAEVNALRNNVPTSPVVFVIIPDDDVCKPFTYWVTNEIDQKTAGANGLTAVRDTLLVYGFDSTGTFSPKTRTPITTTTPAITDASCFGLADGAVNLNAAAGAGGFNYTWSDANVAGGNPMNMAAGTYYVTISDANACEIVDTIEIAQPAQIVTGAISGPAVPHDTVTYTTQDMSTGSTYTWGVSSNGTIVSGQGTKTVEVVWPTFAANSNIWLIETENGCDGDTVSLGVTTNVSGLASSSDEINLFPNPASSVINISASSAISKVEVLDITGKLQLTTTNSNTVSVADLPAGYYFLQLETTNGKAKTLRFTKR